MSVFKTKEACCPVHDINIDSSPSSSLSPPSCSASSPSPPVLPRPRRSPQTPLPETPNMTTQLPARRRSRPQSASVAPAAGGGGGDGGSSGAAAAAPMAMQLQLGRGAKPAIAIYRALQQCGRPWSRAEVFGSAFRGKPLDGMRTVQAHPQTARVARARCVCPAYAACVARRSQWVRVLLAYYRAERARSTGLEGTSSRVLTQGYPAPRTAPRQKKARSWRRPRCGCGRAFPVRMRARVRERERERVGFARTCAPQVMTPVRPSARPPRARALA